MSYLIKIFNDLQYNKYSNALIQLQHIRVSGTTISSYRKIHSLLTGVLERIISLSTSGVYGSIDQKILFDVMTELTKIGILIQYQKKRELIDSHLADGLYQIILQLVSSIESYLRGKENFDKVRIQTEALKIIIDSIIAFHYNRFKRK